MKEIVLLSGGIDSTALLGECNACIARSEALNGLQDEGLSW